MKERLLNFLVCPKCGNDLSLSNAVRDRNEIKEGILICKKCSVEFFIRNFIPRFVSSDSYTKNFSFEWKRWKKVQLDIYSGNQESESVFKSKTGLNKDEVKNKLVLDVGCGSGRFSEVISRWGGEAIGIDLSYSVDAAFENIGSRLNTHFVQADIFSLPFRPETFDIVFSIGVLHHTLNTKQAFNGIVPYVKKGGSLAIWVYSRHCMWPFIGSEFFRKFAPKMPKKLLYYLSVIAVPLYYFYKIRPIKLIFYPILPIDMKPRWDERWLDTFDWYSPLYQWKHTYPEVYAWFLEASFADIKLLNPEVAVTGKKKGLLNVNQ